MTDESLQRISVNKAYSVIHWIASYPAGSAVQGGGGGGGGGERGKVGGGEGRVDRGKLAMEYHPIWVE